VDGFPIQKTPQIQLIFVHFTPPSSTTTQTELCPPFHRNPKHNRFPRKTPKKSPPRQKTVPGTVLFSTKNKPGRGRFSNQAPIKKKPAAPPRVFTSKINSLSSLPLKILPREKLDKKPGRKKPGRGRFPNSKKPKNPKN
jgi:hypothetical protein